MSVSLPGDEILVALFKHHAVENEAQSRAAGRPIFEDVEYIEIRAPGSKDVKPFPATTRSHWFHDPYTGKSTPVTYAERFSRQYRQFKEHNQQTKSGTPLENVPFLTEAGKATLRAMNVYTAEQLAATDGQELKNLGIGAREWKNQAQDYITGAKQNVPNIQMQSELEALRARNEFLEHDNAALLQKRAVIEAQFEEMTSEALREYIKVQTGIAPVGQPAHKTLVRMAMDARPEANKSRVA